jgi:hypothetical protein
MQKAIAFAQRFSTPFYKLSMNLFVIGANQNPRAGQHNRLWDKLIASPYPSVILIAMYVSPSIA